MLLGAFSPANRRAPRKCAVTVFSVRKKNNSFWLLFYFLVLFSICNDAAYIHQRAYTSLACHSRASN